MLVRMSNANYWKRNLHSLAQWFAVDFRAHLKSSVNVPPETAHLITIIQSFDLFYVVVLPY